MFSEVGIPVNIVPFRTNLGLGPSRAMAQYAAESVNRGRTLPLTLPRG